MKQALYDHILNHSIMKKRILLGALALFAIGAMSIQTVEAQEPVKKNQTEKVTEKKVEKEKPAEMKAEKAKKDACCKEAGKECEKKKECCKEAGKECEKKKECCKGAKPKPQSKDDQKQAQSNAEK